MTPTSHCALCPRPIQPGDEAKLPDGRLVHRLCLQSAELEAHLDSTATRHRSLTGWMKDARW